jgi:signal peptidase
MTRGDTILGLLRGTLDGLLIVAVCLALLGPLVARALPTLGYEPIVIVGSSMEPTIPLGSVAVTRAVTSEAIQVGDVVSIRIPDRGVTYTHRVTEVVARSDGRWLRTKGDDNGAADPNLVPASWAIGRVDIKLPGVGYLMRLLSLPSGVAAAMGIGLTLYLAARMVEDLEAARASRRRRASSPQLEVPAILVVDRLPAAE